MTPRRMSVYLDHWERFDPVHVFGYPSSLARLLLFAEQNGRRMMTRSLRAAFVTGELFTPQDRRIIEEHLQVPVADGYGSREAGFIAHQCMEGRYHVTMESLIVELLDSRQQPVSIGESGEVTVTHLDAYGMPFIRYRTGDWARMSAVPCPCGRGLESIECIEGRKTDMLRTADGGWAHALSLIYVLREARGIRRFCIEQSENLDLTVSVVADESFDQAMRQSVVSGLQRRIGGNARISLQQVAEIPHTASGKHRCIVSRAG
ncbi:MAG: phenylacetate--CoA ligase family protein [Planctomycetes bacterium]|nr:phenylacetate--CoA ligase family protein [Planctomycetota bacterium]